MMDYDRTRYHPESAPKAYRDARKDEIDSHRALAIKRNTMHLTDDAARGIVDQIADVLTVAAPPFEWTSRARCPFESSFSYRS